MRSHPAVTLRWTYRSNKSRFPPRCTRVSFATRGVKVIRHSSCPVGLSSAEMGGSSLPVASCAPVSTHEPSTVASSGVTKRICSTVTDCMLVPKILECTHLALVQPIDRCIVIFRMTISSSSCSEAANMAPTHSDDAINSRLKIKGSTAIPHSDLSLTPSRMVRDRV